MLHFNAALSLIWHIGVALWFGEQRLVPALALATRTDMSSRTRTRIPLVAVGGCRRGCSEAFDMLRKRLKSVPVAALLCLKL